MALFNPQMMKQQSQQMPQQNQYLQGNPSTNSGAQTNWMGPPTNSGTGTDFKGAPVSNSGTIGGQGYPANSNNDGTVLSAIKGGTPQQTGTASHDFNPDTGQTREQYRDSWMGSGVSNIDQMRQWVAQNGGQILSDNGTVRTPYGDILDMGTAFRSGNGHPGWTDVGAGMSQPMGGGGQQQQMQGGLLNSAYSPQIMQQIMQSLLGQGMQNPGNGNNISTYFSNGMNNNQNNPQYDMSSLLGLMGQSPLGFSGWNPTNPSPQPQQQFGMNHPGTDPNKRYML